MIGHINPMALLLTALFAIPTALYCGYVLALPLSIAYFLPLNCIMNTKGIRLKESGEIPDPFLLSFSNGLRGFSPEEAFLKAYQHSPTKLLSEVICGLRNGNGLSEVLRAMKPVSEEDRVLLRLIADLVSFSREEASRRMTVYIQYRQEKRKCRSEMTMRLSVLSLRFRVLSCIGSASMAVLAFISPLMSLFSGFHGDIYSLRLEDGFKFEPCIFFALLSTSILSAYLYSKLMNGINGCKLALISGFIFIMVELALATAIGGRI